MTQSGFANLEATQLYKEMFESKCGAGHFQNCENLWITSIGMGTYMGDLSDQTNQQVIKALVKSVENGVNVIDTAINYRRELGERCVGRALQKISGNFSRQQIMVCTKGGFLPQSLGTQWFAKEFGSGKKGVGMEDLVAGCHCMHPVYLEDQLNRSLKNLGLETIDLYYIHNPETQLGKIDDHTFYERLAMAFEFLEEAVEQGKIRYYGLATWNAFRVPEENPQHISLGYVKNLARQVAGNKEDHFKFIQLPLSLSMTEAWSRPSQKLDGKNLSAIKAANELGIHPFSSGSIGQGKALNVAEKLKDRLGSQLKLAGQRALQFTRSAPGLASALVGMKAEGHVDQNLDLCKEPLMEEENFISLFNKK